VPETISDAVRQLEQNYRNKRNISVVAVNLSRLSPVSQDVLSRHSGPAPPRPMHSSEMRAQDDVKRAIYDNFVINATAVRMAGGTLAELSGLTSPSIYSRHGVSIPPRPKHREGWTDAFLLVVFAILFSAVAFVRFNKYDVR
jgi:hypothetical protein